MNKPLHFSVVGKENNNTIHFRFLQNEKRMFMERDTFDSMRLMMEWILLGTWVFVEHRVGFPMVLHLIIFGRVWGVSVEVMGHCLLVACNMFDDMSQWNMVVHSFSCIAISNLIRNKNDSLWWHCLAKWMSTVLSRFLQMEK